MLCIEIIRGLHIPEKYLVTSNRISLRECILTARTLIEIFEYIFKLLNRCSKIWLVLAYNSIPKMVIFLHEHFQASNLWGMVFYSKCCIMRKGVWKPGAIRIRTRELFDTKRDASQYANNEPMDDTRTTWNLQGFLENQSNFELQQFLHNSKFLILLRYFRLAI